MTALACAWFLCPGGQPAVASAFGASDPASGSEGVARASCAAPQPSYSGGGAWPPGCWRPYAAASPFNRPLRRKPPLANGSRRVVRGTLRRKQIQAFLVGHPYETRSDFGHPVYYSGSWDPLYTIRCVRWVRRCEVHGMQVRIPSEALPASGSDAHMAVVDARARLEYDLWEVQTVPLPPLGGVIKVGHGGRTGWGTPRAKGLGSNATAAHFGLSAGVIRAEEWERAAALEGSIQHALFVGVSCTNGRSVYPAAPGTHGTVCADRRSRERAPPLGARYYLKMTDRKINALPVPGWKRPILKAMARYGMIVGDTFGGERHAFGLVAESDTQYNVFGYPGRFAQLGAAWGVPQYHGAYWFDIASGVKWRKFLRVVRPCVSRGTC